MSVWPIKKAWINHQYPYNFSISWSLQITCFMESSIWWLDLCRCCAGNRNCCQFRIAISMLCLKDWIYSNLCYPFCPSQWFIVGKTHQDRGNFYKRKQVIWYCLQFQNFSALSSLQQTCQQARRYGTQDVAQRSVLGSTGSMKSKILGQSLKFQSPPWVY